MNNQKIDQGILNHFEMDLAFGSSENNFECKIPSDLHCCEAGYFLYIEGTEYGGIIDQLEVRSESKEVVYSGRTWQGIIQSKVIMPLKSGESSTADVTITTSDSSGSLVDKYLVISGEANKCIQFILNRLGLNSLFVASVFSSGNSLNKFKFDRFINGYDGIMKMLASIGMKMKIQYIQGKVEVSAVPKYDYSTDEEFDASMVNITLKKKVNAVNHLICLGSGDLDQRQVIHLYADKYGNISQTQTQTGIDEYTAIYDYSSVESYDELFNQGVEELRNLWEPDEMTIDLDDQSDFFDVGDLVGATDDVTKLSGTATIRKKIIQLKNDLVSISYEVGE